LRDDSREPDASPTCLIGGYKGGFQSRRNLMIAASALSTMGAAAEALADDAKVVDYLLVQTVTGLAFDKATNMLSLTGISPVTLFFVDRSAETTRSVCRLARLRRTPRSSGTRRFSTMLQ
jgi:hypothetical protein